MLLQLKLRLHESRESYSLGLQKINLSKSIADFYQALAVVTIQISFLVVRNAEIGLALEIDPFLLHHFGTERVLSISDFF